METILAETKTYISTQLLDDASFPLEYETALISSGLIDSISTLKLVDYLEKKYHIEFLPHEVDKDHLDSIELIAAFVQSKMN